jgi:2,3-dimethylmalate lyase
VEEMKAITSSFDIPVLANMVEGGRTPLLSAQELEELGFNLVIFPTSSTYITAQAMKNLMEEIRDKGTTKNLMGKMIPFEEFNQFIGLTEIRQLESKYVLD